MCEAAEAPEHAFTEKDILIGTLVIFYFSLQMDPWVLVDAYIQTFALCPLKNENVTFILPHQ